MPSRTEQYIHEMVPVIECIHADKHEEAQRLAHEICKHYTWTDGSMEVEAVELMNMVQEYLDGLGTMDKESLLNHFWGELGRIHFATGETGIPLI